MAASVTTLSDNLEFFPVVILLRRAANQGSPTQNDHTGAF
jgi:hypothetical protein